MENIPELNKQQVKYTKVSDEHIIIGYGTALIPVDHPSYLVTNGRNCWTSAVVAYDPDTGVIETRNTIYTPLDESVEKVPLYVEGVEH